MNGRLFAFWPGCARALVSRTKSEQQIEQGTDDKCLSFASVRESVETKQVAEMRAQGPSSSLGERGFGGAYGVGPAVYAEGDHHEQLLWRKDEFHTRGH